MRRAALIPTLVVLALAVALPASAWAGHNADVHSDNMSLLANFDEGPASEDGSDLAFWGRTVILPTYSRLRLVDVTDPLSPRKIGELACPGPQNDVSVWGSLVFMSVDSPRTSSDCGAGAASLAQQEAGTDWEGIRVISIADPANPTQVAAVRTSCGSHTNTLVPDESNGRVLVYVNSYPTVGVRSRTCNDATHEQLSVVEVPLAAPEQAKVVSTPKVTATTPGNGCHDVTVLTEQKIAAAACLQETQLWDISDQVNPKVISTFKNPEIMFDHSAAFSFDGRTLVVGDEFAGAAAPHSCATQTQPAKFGALWFYDISDRRRPVAKSSYQLERQGPLALCTAHNFNVVPLADGRDVLVSAFYEGGTVVLDFTNPAAPRKVGSYIAKTPDSADTWSAYWYDGLIYTNNSGGSPGSRGMDVMALDDPVVASALTLGRLNPQTQEPLPGVTGGGPLTPPPLAGVPAGGSGSAPALERSCRPALGFRSAAAAPRGRALRLRFARAVRRPVAVDVFRQTRGRTVLGERLVARFSRRTRSFTWNGRATVGRRAVADGIYVVRLRMRLGRGRSDVRRFALRRNGGRWSVRPSYYARPPCGLLAAFKLERPVFGGRRNREVGIAYRLNRRSDVTIVVTRGTRVIRRWSLRARQAGRTHRLRLDSERLPRGDYRVRILVQRQGRTVSRTLVARRL